MSANYPTITRANSVAYLITTGLGYCCEWFFWSRYGKVSADLIAARLGVEVNTIRRHRLWFREDKLSCTCEQRCMKCHLTKETADA